MIKFLQDWIDRWLFSPVDARWLALLRVLIALAYPYFFLSSAAELGYRAPDFIVVIFGDFIASDFYKPIVLVFCGLLALGIRARWVGCALLLLLFPLMWGPYGNLSRLILILGLIFFTLMPSGTVRFPWTASPDGEIPEAGPCWPLRLMQLLLTTVYGVNALAKTNLNYLRGETLMDMSITYENFHVDLSSGYWAVGSLFIPLSLAAIASVITEYALALGLWSHRWKWIVAIIGICFHLILTTIVQIFMLHIVSIFFYLVFLLPLIPREVQIAHGHAKTQESSFT